MVKLFFSCEHGGNVIPTEYHSLFPGAEETLNTHRGWDIGILQVAKAVSQELTINLQYSEISRLLVELNRSLDNPQLFSNYSNNLSQPEKQAVLSKYYFPYRNRCEDEIRRFINTNHQVIHISFHSFTPVLDGVERDCGVGLLFDPSRTTEYNYCKAWRQSLESLNPPFAIKFNYPYLGIEDGFTTYLRTKYPDPSYAGIELEVNQKYLLDEKSRAAIINLLKTSLQNTLIQFNTDN